MPERDLSDGLSQCADHFSPLIGDQRTGETFTEILRGIIGAETLCCSQIAAASPKLADKDYSEKRVRQFAKGETTKRSSIDEEVLSGKLRERSVEHLQEQEGKPWIVWDLSSLRKESAREMEDLPRISHDKTHLSRVEKHSAPSVTVRTATYAGDSVRSCRHSRSGKSNGSIVAAGKWQQPGFRCSDGL